jgi:hypothetical protein
MSNESEKIIKSLENYIDIERKLYELYPKKEKQIKKNNNNKNIINPSSPVTIKRLMDNLLNAAKIDDINEVDNILTDINIEIVKSFSFKDDDLSKIYEIFSKMRYTMDHYSSHRPRLKKMLNLYRELKIILTNYKQEGPLKQIFENIKFEMQSTLNDALINANIDALTTLREQERQIRKLDIRVKNERPDLYKEYSITMKDIARCIILLSILQPIEKDGKIIFHKDGINKITDNFSSFFSIFSDFISSFEKP